MRNICAASHETGGMGGSRNRTKTVDKTYALKQILIFDRDNVSIIVHTIHKNQRIFQTDPLTCKEIRTKVYIYVGTGRLYSIIKVISKSDSC